MNSRAEQIREHMAVISIDGMHIGTVDRVEAGQIKLSRGDNSDVDGGHRYLPLSWVESVEDDTVALSVLKAEIEAGMDEEGEEVAGDDPDDTVRLNANPVVSEGEDPDFSNHS